MRTIKKLGLFAMIFGGVLILGNLNEVSAQQGGSLQWRGTVDDHIQIVIRGQRATVTTLSGTVYNDARYDFNGGGGRWRNGQDYRASVDKQDGRGKVRVVQQPNRRNNYTTIIQVDDPKGGPDRYRLEVTWN